MSVSEWFEWEEAVSPNLGVFLTQLREHASSWIDLDPLDSQVYALEEGLTVGLDVSDLDRYIVVRTLRVDYTPSGVVCGEDRTYQFMGMLDRSCHEYHQVLSAPDRPSEAAGEVAAWLYREACRPVELREWRNADDSFKRYCLADSDRRLCCSGNPYLPVRVGPPTAIYTVRTLGRLRGETS
jgi:hypothetical protein